VRHKYQGEIEYKEGNFEVPKKIFPKRLGYIKLRVNSKWVGNARIMAGNSNVVFCEDWRIQIFSKIQKNQTPQVFFSCSPSWICS